MHRWEKDEEEAVVVGRIMPGRLRVRLSSGEELTARLSGFLWFRQVDPSVGAQVRIVRGLQGPEPATIVYCGREAPGWSA